MPTALDTTLHSFRYSLAFLREQVSDVPESRLCEQPGGFVNHPVWTIGHLTHTCEMIGEVIGIEAWLPATHAKLFGAGSAPVADRGTYPCVAELFVELRTAEERVISGVRRLTDAQLEQPFPDPAYADVFPSVGHALTQVLAGHTAYHVGQVGAWRRATGLPAMRRSYE
ncbi:MAG TPA: DinB family protein [Phycisphaerales bacterium]|nr:DinB family protein [Phycisphaerales bacterium]